MTKPSEIVLTVPPLAGTMNHAEREFAAALLVRACQVLGDEWQPVALRQLGDVIKADLEARTEPVFSLSRNPFFRPDFHELADGKFGRWIGEPGISAIELTPAGIEALSRWRRSSAETGATP